MSSDEASSSCFGDDKENCDSDCEDRSDSAQCFAAYARIAIYLCIINILRIVISRLTFSFAILFLHAHS